MTQREQTLSRQLEECQQELAAARAHHIGETMGAEVLHQAGKPDQRGGDECNGNDDELIEPSERCV